MHHRGDYDFDVISGPSTRPAPPPPARPAGGAAPGEPRPEAGAAGGPKG